MVANTIGCSVLKMTSQISPLARFEKVHLICKNSLALPNKPLRALTVINTIKSKQCFNLDKKLGLVNISTGKILSVAIFLKIISPLATISQMKCSTSMYLVLSRYILFLVK